MSKIYEHYGHKLYCSELFYQFVCVFSAYVYGVFQVEKINFQFTVIGYVDIALLQVTAFI